MAQTQYGLSKSKAVEFSVKNEPWVKYKLEDRTTLFAKFIMIKVYKTGEYDANGQPIYAWSSQNLITTIAAEENRGTPSDSPPVSTNATDYQVTPVDFERVGSEQWNIYELSDGALLRVKLEVMNVARTDKYSADGEPFYLVGSGPLTRVKVPPELLRKQTSVLSQKKDIYR